MRRLLTFALIAAACLAACGGGNDKKDAADTVRQFFTALQKQDAAKLCDRLLTKDFIEQATQATGDEARKQCKSQFKDLKASDFKLVSVDKVTVNGDKATATTTIERGGQTQPQVFSLKKEDGDWRLANSGQ
jgi:predicted lipid-binding transport protein (Tim44 family)